MHKILIVEDNEIIAEQLLFFLRRHSFDCYWIDNGEECIEKIESINPDIILMDIRLSGELDGIETAMQIKPISDAAVIFVSSFTDPEVLERALSAEPFAFVSKQASQNELKIQIEYAIIKRAKLIEDKNLIKSLQISSQKFENIFNSSHDAIFYVDSNLEISFWNPSAQRIFGYTAEEALGGRLDLLIIPEESREEFVYSYNTWIRTKEKALMNYTFELDALKKNGKTVAAEMSLAIIDFETERAVCGFVRDVTEKVIAEEEITKLIEEMQISKEIIEQNANDLVLLNSKLIESEYQLQELNADKDKFISIIAHDLKGPFQGLIGYSEILFQNADDLEKPEVKELSEHVYNSVTQLFKLLESLLNWSRLQRGAIECITIDFKFDLVLKHTVDLIKYRAEQKNINLSYECPDDIVIFGDVNMISTVMRNLLTNALKFTPDGGSVYVQAKNAPGKMVSISVKDTGVGIPKHHLDALFRFDTYHSTPGTANEQGTGLGLILCKELIDKNEGRLLVQSKVGEGTTFEIILPAGEINELQ